MRSSFITSSPDVHGLPDLQVREVAFVGRSNVGKSSLLNKIAAAKIARTSKTPGRTQLINLFEVQAKDLRFGLADLPGYGFAQAPKAVRLGWLSMIQGYLLERPRLSAVLLLIDVRRGIEEEDAEIFTWLNEALPEDRETEVILVGTKVDKLNKARQKPALHELAAGLGVSKEDVLGVSAQSGQGLEALATRIRTLVSG